MILNYEKTITDSTGTKIVLDKGMVFDLTDADGDLDWLCVVDIKRHKDEIHVLLHSEAHGGCIETDALIHTSVDSNISSAFYDLEFVDTHDIKTNRFMRLTIGELRKQISELELTNQRRIEV